MDVVVFELFPCLLRIERDKYIYKVQTQGDRPNHMSSVDIRTSQMFKMLVTSWKF